MLLRTWVFGTTMVGVLGLGSSAFAQTTDIRVERVQFAKGKTGTKLEGTLKGREIVDYRLGAQAGQTMVVKLSTKSTATYFNVMAPGETEVAFFIGSTEGDEYEGQLPANGDYTIRVYQMRSAARRGEVASYSLDVEITSKASGVSGDALVPGTEFHATGYVPCAREAGQPMANCKFGVVREGGGSGRVTVFWPDGGNRVLFFEKGVPTDFDRSEADGGAQMKVEKNADVFMITIGDQRFEIFEAVILGG
jgi:hypothetical protein